VCHWMELDLVGMVFFILGGVGMGGVRSGWRGSCWCCYEWS
jgi:hypothetical protein